LQRCKLIEKRKRGNRSNAYLVYPPEYFSAESETQALIESRLRRGKGGREAKGKEMLERVSTAEEVAEAPAAYAYEATGPANRANREEETGVHPVHLEELTGSVSNIFTVNLVHAAEGELSAPSPCSEFTAAVNSVHLKSNHKNIDQKISLQDGLNRLQKRGESALLSPDPQERGGPDRPGEGGPDRPEEKNLETKAPVNSPPVTGKPGVEGEQPGSKVLVAADQPMEVSADFSAVKNAFRRKGYQAADRLISELLRGYEPRAVKAAIEKTDFNLARNPAAVIKWMLATGSYVVPIERKAQAPVPETRAPDPAEDAAIREMIKKTKAGLLAKTLQKAL